MYTTIGKSVQRIDAQDKVNGATKFTNDYYAPGLLHAQLVISPYAHAKITHIDLEAALASTGVRAIVTGADFPYLTGSMLDDRAPLAFDKVRYYGEPVAVVVADCAYEAKRAAALVHIDYEPLPVVNSPSGAFDNDAPLVHEQLESYRNRKPEVIFPLPNSNIANHAKIRKGDIKLGWLESDVEVESSYSFAQSDHVALEQRCARVEIKPDGNVIVYSSSQAPYVIKKYMSRFLKIDADKIIVHTPPVGGAFGGKAMVQLEYIAYLASKAVGGRMVSLANIREEDLISSPVHIGLEAKVKLGATKEGKLKAAEITYYWDSGAYSAQGASISRAGAADCTGPYSIDNVHCDSYCMYTNHPFATSFRGFGHSEFMFAIERTMDLLAEKLGICPMELRMKNAIAAGDTTPTMTPLTTSNIGNLSKCLARAKELIQWEEGTRIEVGPHTVRAKGISSIWKTSSTPTNAISGATITFNYDGTVNLSVGAVELGQGTKTALAQILSERIKIDVNKINVTMEVNTQVNPEHWKTVASNTTYMAGRAVLAAADDAIRKLYVIAAIVLFCAPEDLTIGEGKVFLKHNPQKYVYIKDIANGYMYPAGHAIGGQIIGGGSDVIRHITVMNKETGEGNPGPEWTVGAEAIEVEFNTRDYTYKVLKAVAVLDAGQVINPTLAEGVVRGAMSMGLSFARNETFVFDDAGIIQNPNLRQYKLIRFGEQPEYIVDFVETPQIDAPYGARGIGEHGLIGMPAALANSLSLAAGVHLRHLPLTPERIWQTAQEGNDDDLL